MGKDVNIRRAKIAEMVAPEGRELMVIGGGYWGRGKTGADAMKSAMSAAGLRSLHRQKVMVFEVAEGAYVSDDGCICYKTGERSEEKLRGVLL